MPADVSISLNGSQVGGILAGRAEYLGSDTVTILRSVLAVCVWQFVLLVAQGPWSIAPLVF